MSENQAKLIVLIMALFTFLAAFLMYSYQNEIRHFLYPENYIQPVVEIDQEKLNKLISENEKKQKEKDRLIQQEQDIIKNSSINAKNILSEGAKSGEATMDSMKKMVESYEKAQAEVDKTRMEIKNLENSTTTK